MPAAAATSPIGLSRAAWAISISERARGAAGEEAGDGARDEAEDEVADGTGEEAAGAVTSFTESGGRGSDVKPELYSIGDPAAGRPPVGDRQCAVERPRINQRDQLLSAPDDVLLTDVLLANALLGKPKPRASPSTLKHAATRAAGGDQSPQRGNVLAPIRNSSTARAACRPSRIAQTTRDWPRRMSPAAKTFSWLVR